MRRSSVHLHVVELAAGGGPPLVLLHGFGDTHAAWLASIREVAPARRTVAFDLRGHGDSGWPADGDYGLEATVDDLAAVLDAIGAPRAIVAGHSTGGMTALAFAARAPERLVGLALLDVDPLRFKDGLARLPAFAGPEAAADLASFAAGLRAAGDRRTLESIAAWLEPRVRRGDDGLWRWKQDPRLRPRTAVAPPAPMSEAEVDALQARVADAAIPLLVVRGERSAACTSEGARRCVARLGARAALEEVPGAGHDLLREAPCAVAAALRRALDAS